MRADVAIMGGGLAGLSAGLRAAELGCMVAIFEQGAEDNYLCNSRIAGGIVHVAYNDPKADPSVILQSIDAATSGHVENSQAKSLARDGGRMVDWLQHNGGKFIRFSQIDWHRWCMAPPRPLGPGLDWEGRGPDVLLRNLTKKFQQAGGQLHLGAKVKGISLVEGGANLLVERQGQEMSCDARAVVIADGGFQGNPDLFKQHIGPRPDLVCQRNARTGRGDGLQLAIPLGAAVVGTDHFYGHLLSRDALSNPKLWPYPQLDELVASTMVVDKTGQRFLDEGAGGIFLANKLAGSNDPVRGIVVLDAAIWDKVGQSGRIPVNPHLKRAGATIHEAGSLAELANTAGIDSDQFEKTVSDWNNAVDAKAGFAPPRTVTAKPNRLEKMTPWPIRVAPFMAIPMCPGITHTMGGILIDGASRVLRDDRSVIDGLFAAGSATGGLEGGGAVGYIGGLSKAGVFGMLAGEAAAQLVRRDRTAPIPAQPTERP